MAGGTDYNTEYDGQQVRAQAARDFVLTQGKMGYEKAVQAPYEKPPEAEYEKPTAAHIETRSLYNKVQDYGKRNKDSSCNGA